MSSSFRRSYVPKIAFIGAGHIGGTLALLAAQKKLGDVVLFDIAEGTAQGKALDLAQASPLEGYNVHLRGTQHYEDVAGADVVIVTAGVPRKGAMTRDDLLDTNVKVMKDVASHLKVHCPDAFIIVISNPLDAMVYTMARITERPKTHVVGMAGVLDSSRLRYFIAEKLKVSVQDVMAFVLGGHGDDMVPVVQYCSVGGIPVTQLMSQSDLDAIVERTRKGGGEIVGLLQTGSAFYAPAASAITMAESYLRNERRMVPAAAYCEGEYGIEGLFIGVPTLIGQGGMEKIIEVQLSDADSQALKQSASHVRLLTQEVDKRLA